MPTLRVGSTAAVLLLAGCAGNPLGDTGPAAAGQSTEMNGRWILAAPDAPTCGMNFMNTQGNEQGTVEPEGGCPGNLFMSRHWTLAQGALTISDDENQPLAQLAFANGRFEGQSTSGTPVTLTPPPP